MSWLPWANFFIGSWLVFSPFSLGVHQLSLIYSDVVTGLLVSLVSISELRAPKEWQRWAVALFGIWLLFAPLIFWAQNSSVSSNDTFAGILLVLLSVAVPRKQHALSEIPPQWSYNPSSWHHRIPVIILAVFGFFVARQMSSFQLGYVSTIWDPFFGNGTKNVLTSTVARAFPISDAGLGATTYLIEGMSGLIGDTRRWKTMPWMVFLFFVLVVPAGVVSIVLIMLQPVVVGAWCWLCLITAFTTLISIPPAVDEVFASYQFLAQCRRDKKSLWKSFWLGDPTEMEPSVKTAESTAHSTAGIGMIWTLFICAVIGVGVVLIPVFFQLPKLAANSDYVSGALITTFAVLAFAEPIRSTRLLNILLGGWLCAAALIFKNLGGAVIAIQLVAGVALIALSWRKGPIEERYGGWNRYII